MSARIINLRRERRRRAREAAREAAGEAAVRHGEARALRELRAARAALEARRLEGHRRGGGENTDGG